MPHQTTIPSNNYQERVELSFKRIFCGSGLDRAAALLIYDSAY
jgi:hypothetical protein